jgi:hypothetical protein
MKKHRTLQFAATGAFISLLFVVTGHCMDIATPAINLDRQVFYNWLALILSPASFLLRLNDPDGPIVPGVFFAGVIIALNALWYAAMRHVYLVVAPPSNVRASMPTPALAGAAGSSGLSGSLSSRRESPSELLADRYEHRLSAEQASSALDDGEVAVLSESSSR